MTTSRRNTTVRQLEILVDFMERHQDLALGRVRSKEGRVVASRLWSDCAELLNVEGPSRTGKEWSRFWNDFKTRVRSKLAQINLCVSGTGGGPYNAPQLGPIEDRVAAILGRDVGPLQGVRHVPVFDENACQMSVTPGPSASQESDPSNTAGSQSILVCGINDDDFLEEEQQQLSFDRPDTPPLHMSSAENVYEPTPQPLEQRPPHSSHTAPTPARTRTTSGSTYSVRRPRGHRVARPPRHAVTALEDSRAMIARIEESRARTEAMVAEAALKNAEAALKNAEASLKSADTMQKFAESVQIIAKSFERWTKSLPRQRADSDD